MAGGSLYERDPLFLNFARILEKGVVVGWVAEFARGVSMGSHGSDLKL